MGGSAFESDPNPLSTPRMPKAVYDSVKSRCHTILKEYYTHVATPIEAPEKKDYGDVDFLVACPTELCIRSSDRVETVARALGAERTISGNGDCPTVNYALPWPKELRGGAQASDEGEGDTFVQVDVGVCVDKQGWEWVLFLHAHGDLWTIVGSIIRRYGLSVSVSGLCLRIKEIDRIDRKRSMVFLTKTPSDVLSFLGLDESRCLHQFESVQNLYEYAATCRYFCTYEDEGVKGRDEDNELGPVGRKNHRRTMKQRHLLRKWVEEFIPQSRASGAYNKRAPSREEIRDEAFQRFGVKDEYDHKLDTWCRERGNDDIWKNAIKTSLPTADDVAPSLRTAAIRGLRAVIRGNLSYGVMPPSLVKSDGFYDMEALVEFVTREWQGVGVIELEKQLLRAAARREGKTTT